MDRGPTYLYFVKYEHSPHRVAAAPQQLEESLLRFKYTALALDRLDKERSCVLAVKLKRTFNVRDLAIANCSQTSIIIKGRSNLGKVGTETITTLGVFLVGCGEPVKSQEDREVEASPGSPCIAGDVWA